MKISLLRHGRPDADLLSSIRAKDFSTWLLAYDEAGIDRSLPPPDVVRRSLASCTLLLTSPARRAVESADALDLRAGRRIAIDAREAPLPTKIVWPLSHRPAVFTVIARVLWVLGLARAKEDKQAVRLRACSLAGQLAALACESGNVALIGHGYMNIFLRKALEATGWHSLESGNHGYWSISQFEKKAQ
ncbi:MAG: hypothetical protein ABI273_03310 [Lacunisphaera sp.]